MFFYFEACVHDSTILPFPAPTCILPKIAYTLVQYYCTTIGIGIIGQYAARDPPSDLPFVCHTYAIHHTILVITISCKGQAARAE